MNNEPYEEIAGFPGWIKVCAWCYPNDKIFILFPDLRGHVQISHSICPRHNAAFLASLKTRVAQAKTPAGETLWSNKLETMKG